MLRRVVGTARGWRIGSWVVLGIASVITLLSVALVFGALHNDRAIAANLGTAVAEVDQVLGNRTIIRYETPDGVAHSPPNGVLYPQGLEAGKRVRIEYDTTEPELVKVAGRTWVLTLLPAGLTMLITWAVAGPLWWWLRSRASRPVAPR